MGVILVLHSLCSSIDLLGARGRNRTGTGGDPQRILSPLRLPIPPPGHGYRMNDLGDD